MHECTVQRNRHATIHCMREFIDYCTASKVGAALEYTIGHRELGIGIDYSCKHSLTNALTVGHITYNEISLVGCHTLTIIKINVGRACKVIALVKEEHIGIRTHLRLQSCLGDTVEHHQCLSALGCTVIAVTYHSRKVVCVVAARSLAHAFRHKPGITCHRAVGHNHLYARVGSNALVVPRIGCSCGCHCQACTHDVEVDSVKCAALYVHHCHPQLVKLVVSSHVRTVGVWVGIFVLCIVYRS